MEKLLSRSSTFDDVISLLSSSCAGYVETERMPILERSFGDTSAVIKFSSLSLRLKRDRGEMFIDLGSEHFGWYASNYIIGFINKKMHKDENIDKIDLYYAVNFIVNNWDFIVNIFSNDSHILNLKRFITEKCKSRWGM